jgi:hypothetical protein
MTWKTAESLEISSGWLPRMRCSKVCFFIWNVDLTNPVTELYEKAGSGYLSNHITYNVKPSGEANNNDWPRCEEVRQAILEKLPIFLHQIDKRRLKNASMHHLLGDKSYFLVRDCRNLKVEKRLNSDRCISRERQANPFEFDVSAEITTEENAHVILWLKKADRVDICE